MRTIPERGEVKIRNRVTKNRNPGYRPENLFLYFCQIRAVGEKVMRRASVFLRTRNNWNYQSLWRALN